MGSSLELTRGYVYTTGTEDAAMPDFEPTASAAHAVILHDQIAELSRFVV